MERILRSGGIRSLPLRDGWLPTAGCENERGHANEFETGDHDRHRIQA
jgi:hypothetical protein